MVSRMYKYKFRYGKEGLRKKSGVHAACLLASVCASF